MESAQCAQTCFALTRCPARFMPLFKTEFIGMVQAQKSKRHVDGPGLLSLADALPSHAQSGCATQLDVQAKLDDPVSLASAKCTHEQQLDLLPAHLHADSMTCHLCCVVVVQALLSSLAGPACPCSPAWAAVSQDHLVRHLPCNRCDMLLVMVQALSGSPASPASHSGLPLAAADLLPVIMEQLEACATADAHIEGPPELEAAVADTLTSVRMHVAESHAKLRTLRRRGHPKVSRRRCMFCATQCWPGPCLLWRSAVSSDRDTAIYQARTSNV